MASKKITSWLGYHFESSCETTPEYKAFQNAVIADIRRMVKPFGFTVEAHRNHFEFSAVLHHAESDRYVYVSIPDVRFWPDEWYNHVLIRTMKHSRDWTGGPNNYCHWEDIGKTARCLINY